MSPNDPSETFELKQLGNRPWSEDQPALLCRAAEFQDQASVPCLPISEHVEWVSCVFVAVSENATVHSSGSDQIGPSLASKSGYKSKAWW
ncbi:hypothetical protein [Stenotrophomonas maltophilia]|uniref:hypothetical protein n=1 Tax=Stenotrophomonas maltophilia TaxID=40324 RepID=UPI0012FAE7D1|nr:hypothetical protein [Stenotrophomonas maltophilia]